ncbi:hypothetical protein Q8A67_021798 [Cirrhinus molitorella]|uniref:Uncharacterized protein n=1 Tax=Cirrhinus molitorella TaxID=172907 RepID=A0AA88TDD8_9TELE|nr:hypothetical protein Q8A67_021798 [Cirrhinus molitorella]
MTKAVLSRRSRVSKFPAPLLSAAADGEGGCAHRSLPAQCVQPLSRSLRAADSKGGEVYHVFFYRRASEEADP